MIKVRIQGVRISYYGIQTICEFISVMNIWIFDMLSSFKSWIGECDYDGVWWLLNELAHIAYIWIIGIAYK